MTNLAKPSRVSGRSLPPPAYAGGLAKGDKLTKGGRLARF